MKEGFGLDAEGQIGSQDARENFLSGLHEALGPARLLSFEGVHFDGQLGRALDIRQIEESPAAKLCAIGEIGILGERVVLPAARSRLWPFGARRRRCR